MPTTDDRLIAGTVSTQGLVTLFGDSTEKANGVMTILSANDWVARVNSSSYKTTGPTGAWAGEWWSVYNYLQYGGVCKILDHSNDQNLQPVRGSFNYNDSFDFDVAFSNNKLEPTTTNSELNSNNVMFQFFDQKNILYFLNNANQKNIKLVNYNKLYNISSDTTFDIEEYNGTPENIKSFANNFRYALNKHIALITTDGTVVCFGDNSSGQCDVPAGLTGVKEVSCGALHTMALKTDGTLVGWGLNGEGQITPPGGLTGVKQVTCGDNHTCLLKSDGTVVCFGRDTFSSAPNTSLGKILGTDSNGKGITSTSNDLLGTAVKIAGITLTNINYIDANRYSTVAFGPGSTMGLVYTWGNSAVKSEDIYPNTRNSAYFTTIYNNLLIDPILGVLGPGSTKNFIYGKNLKISTYQHSDSQFYYLDSNNKYIKNIQDSFNLFNPILQTPTKIRINIIDFSIYTDKIIVLAENKRLYTFFVGSDIRDIFGYSPLIIKNLFIGSQNINTVLTGDNTVIQYNMSNGNSYADSFITAISNVGITYMDISQQTKQGSANKSEFYVKASDGSIITRCIGNSDYGQCLGTTFDGTPIQDEIDTGFINNVTRSTKINGLTLTDCQKVFGFDNYTLALKNNNTLIGFGFNDEGQCLGTTFDGTAITDTPSGQSTKINGLTLTSVDLVIPLQTGSIVRKTDNTLVAWGTSVTTSSFPTTTNILDINIICNDGGTNIVGIGLKPNNIVINLFTGGELEFPSTPVALNKTKVTYNTDTVAFYVLLANGKIYNTLTKTYVPIDDIVSSFHYKNNTFIYTTPSGVKENVLKITGNNFVNDDYTCVFPEQKVITNPWSATDNPVVSVSSDAAGCLARNYATTKRWSPFSGINRGKLLNSVNIQSNSNPLLTTTVKTTSLNEPYFDINKTFSEKSLNTQFTYSQIQKRLNNAFIKYKFELNTEETRLSLANDAKSVLDIVKNENGLTSYVVVCNETNNTQTTISEGNIIVDITINFFGSIETVTYQVSINNETIDIFNT